MRKSRQGVLTERVTNGKAMIENDSDVLFILFHILLKKVFLEVRNILTNLIEIISCGFCTVLTGAIYGHIYALFSQKLQNKLLAGFFFFF